MLNKSELKQKYKDEKVFVLPSNLVQNISDKFNKLKHDPAIWKKYDNLGLYIPRYEAEYNLAFQQIIPYFLVTNSDESKFYVGKRIKGDSRLEGMLSLGFGGHINECDGTNQAVFKALYREMNEELNIEPTSSFKFIGTMRDLVSDTSEHFGLIFIIKSEETTISIKETDTLEGLWMTKQEMFDSYGKFESWAKYLLDHFYEN